MPLFFFKHGTLKIADASGTGGSNVVTVDIENAVLSVGLNRQRIVRDVRGSLSSGYVVDGDDQPTDLTLEGEFRGWLGINGTPDQIPIYEAVNGLGQASGWTSDNDGGDTFMFILEIAFAVPGGGTETHTWTRCFVQGNMGFQESRDGNTATFTCQSLDTAPAIA